MNGSKVVLSFFSLVFFGGLVVWFGVFDVSAKVKHWDVTTKVLEIIKERSIDVRADDISVPDLSDTKMVSRGAKNFDAMCSQCHLSPIKEPTELNLGLYPQPPVFYKEEHGEHEEKNTFWTIKNGLKLTGMPAWGDFHTDEQIWEMVAFLQQIKGMSKSEYTRLIGEGGHTHKGGGHQEHDRVKTTHHEDASSHGVHNH